MLLLAGAAVLWIASSLILKFVYNHTNVESALIGLSIGALAFLYPNIVMILLKEEKPRATQMKAPSIDMTIE